ncbi:MAG: cupredoxin domain-containing protein [Nanoarchaeota archaeon]|nr:cupredoxin domain-containing protein [Nanoarchaeota archaeon]
MAKRSKKKVMKRTKKKKRFGLVVALVVLIVIAAAGAFLLTNWDRNPTASDEDQQNNLGELENPIAIPIISGQSYDVKIENSEFNPSELIISINNTVIWTNMDSVVHTITFDLEGEFGFPGLSPGGTYSKTFDSKGTYSYHCEIHPSMKGTIVVQ